MKKIFILFSIICFVVLFSDNVSGQNVENTVISPATSHGQDLDLTAVMAVFQESKDLEDFEKKLNEKDGVNNLDLNENGEVDYIRVVEQEKDNYRIIILQAVLGENQSQDVAVINVEKKSDEEIKVECQGNEVIYGANYYVVPPPTVRVYVWPIWRIMFAPHYIVYRSPWHYHRYPPYWYGRPPVHYSVYYSRNVVITGKGIYVYSRNTIVRRPPHYYRPHHSNVIVKRPPRNISINNNRNNNNLNKNNQNIRSNQNARPGNQNNRNNNVRPNNNRPNSRYNKGGGKKR